MPDALISLGANLGDVRATMFAASQCLVDEFGPGNVRFSQLVATPPIGGPDGQSEFLNGVAAVHTGGSSWELWNSIKLVESELGRVRQNRWEARRIDVDLILFGNERIWTPHFKVPHPRMCMRSFVLEPAQEVAADWIDPVTGWSLRSLNQNLVNATTLHSPIIIATTSEDMQSSLQDLLRSSNANQSLINIKWMRLDQDKQIEHPTRSSLFILCTQTPDPESILWEDFHVEWAERLNLTASAQYPRLPIDGPRYLLPANDLEWAAHEIVAAISAMHCPVRPTGIQFNWPFEATGE